jgi:hypothetical protein
MYVDNIIIKAIQSKTTYILEAIRGMRVSISFPQEVPLARFSFLLVVARGCWSFLPTQLGIFQTIIKK